MTSGMAMVPGNVWAKPVTGDRIIATALKTSICSILVNSQATNSDSNTAMMLSNQFLTKSRTMLSSEKNVMRAMRL